MLNNGLDIQAGCLGLGSVRVVAVSDSILAGGGYAGNTTKNQYMPLRKGMTLDVADIGGAGDDIVLVFTVMVKE